MSDNLKNSSLLLRRYQIYFELQKESDDHLSAKTIPLSSKTKFTVCNGGGGRPPVTIRVHAL